MINIITKFICEDCGKEVEILHINPLLIKKCYECWLKNYRKKDE